MKSLKPLFFVALLFTSTSLLGADATGVLSEAVDPRLQQGLEDLVRELGLATAVEEKKLSLALLIVTNPARPRLAELNGHQMVYAASLPKIAILLGAAVAIHEGRLVMDAKTA